MDVPEFLFCLCPLWDVLVTSWVFTLFQYTLETFCEGRSTGYVHEPFMGQPIDGPQNGIPPPPWQIPCVADQMFHDHTKLLEVPHTAVIKVCQTELFVLVSWSTSLLKMKLRYLHGDNLSNQL